MVCLVASTFFETVGRPGAPLAGALLAQVGVMAAGADVARDEGGGGPLLEVSPAINATLCAALHHLGGEFVLLVLPLNLNEKVAHPAESWLKKP